MDPANILWSTADQQRGDTIQALGNAYFRTPNLDRLCAEGTVSWPNTLIRQSAWQGSRRLLGLLRQQEEESL
jgi:hypothetical protein